MVSRSVASGLLTIALAGCSTNRDNDIYGAFYEPGKEYSFRGQKVLILYATDEKFGEQKLSKDGIVKWPEMNNLKLIEDVTKRLQGGGAYVSFHPVFSDDSDLSLRLCQYDRNWDALLITYPEFNASTIRDENLRDVYIPMLHDGKLVIGRLGTMASIISSGPVISSKSLSKGLKYVIKDKSKGVF